MIRWLLVSGYILEGFCSGKNWTRWTLRSLPNLRLSEEFASAEKKGDGWEEWLVWFSKIWETAEKFHEIKPYSAQAIVCFLDAHCGALDFGDQAHKILLTVALTLLALATLPFLVWPVLWSGKSSQSLLWIKSSLWPALLTANLIEHLEKGLKQLAWPMSSPVLP